MFYKRNQIEEAISRTNGELRSEPSKELRIRLKRLLDLDRKLKRNTRSADPAKANYAFYSADAPGKGVEVLFSEYEAFALMLGFLLLDHRWPQRFVLDTMRGIRPDLEQEHRRILRLNPESLFDKEGVRRATQSGNVDAGNADPAFLLIVSDRRTGDRSSGGPYARIFQDTLSAFKFQLEKAGRSCTWLELVTPAWTLRNHLVNSIPRSRGRTG
jgi:hypothetical protein